jgi:hypothetical protein
MNRQKKNKSKQGKGSPWGQIQLGSFKAEFPQPRLPKLLGSAKALTNKTSVYPTISLDVPILQEVVSIAAGNAAGVVAIDISKISNFTTRFGALFKEYAIVGARFELRMNNVVQGAGVIGVYLDEISATAPGAGSTLDSARVDVLISPQFTAGGSYRIDWTPRDILDLDYVSTGTTFTPLYLKAFCNVASFNTLAATTGDLIITGALAIELRGYV